MDIEERLITYMLDVYEQYCYYALEIKQEDFDKSFFDSEGQEISDRDYLLQNHDEILNEETFDALYDIIIDEGDGKDIPLRRFVYFFCGTYFIYNYYDGNNSLIRFLKQTPIEQIEDLFVENYDFGIAMIQSYFCGLIDPERCNESIERIKENGDEQYMDGFFTNALLSNYITLNDLLRNIICDLYNLYISQGYGDIEALSTTWQYFLNNFDPIGTLDQMGVDCESKEKYKQYMFGLIIADLYEDVTNGSIIESDNEKDRMADVFPVIAATFGLIKIPDDEDLRNRMLKHFILLQDEHEKRKDNRRKTIKDKRTAVLQKVNPLYQIDEITFSKQ